ncbi:hypothetical protein [Microbacterium sp. XT11]|uniref:hypothetical protein n=1 Tax=Microbacterium sp. XT11 TaxID=367477 RepID=UPI0007430E20|nr:hypothetical protein [Microbacterium sp. XT11]ALX66421.1 hypothetical protein AB663_001577 [Microbacterium sp. XT11]
MSEHRWGVRTSVSIDGTAVFVAQDEDIDKLKQRIERAAETTGRFVEFTAAGGSEVRALVGRGSRVIIITHHGPTPELEPIGLPTFGEWDL